MSRPFGGATVREALDSAVVAIAAGGSDTPRLDAELLLASALGVDRRALLMEPSGEVAGAAVRTFQDFVRRRSVTREPVAYILGRKAFRHIELRVDPRVLVPRPETELLVEIGLELPRGARVVDVGTGSGAVALALKHERPDLDVLGTDSSSEALDVARSNAAALGLDVEFARGDLLAGIGACDAILANPPYVAQGDRATLPPEVAEHEPPGALFAGDDGLDAVRRLVAEAGGALAPGGLLAIEVGLGQAPAVRALLQAQGFAGVHARTDLAGVDRAVVARREVRA